MWGMGAKAQKSGLMVVSLCLWISQPLLWALCLERQLLETWAELVQLLQTLQGMEKEEFPFLYVYVQVELHLYLNSCAKMPQDKDSVVWILVAEKHTEIVEKLADKTVKLLLGVSF